MKINNHSNTGKKTIVFNCDSICKWKGRRVIISEFNYNVNKHSREIAMMRSFVGAHEIIRIMEC